MYFSLVDQFPRVLLYLLDLLVRFIVERKVEIFKVGDLHYCVLLILIVLVFLVLKDIQANLLQELMLKEGTSKELFPADPVFFIEAEHLNNDLLQRLADGQACLWKLNAVSLHQLHELDFARVEVFEGILFEAHVV